MVPWCPPASSSSTRCEPMKPTPPVTTVRMPRPHALTGGGSRVGALGCRVMRRGALVLVTGGSGFIGSPVVDALVAAGHRPRIYDIRPSRYHPDLPAVMADLGDLERLCAAMSDCDAAIHLAASADVNEVLADPVDAERVNARGTLHVLEAARRCRVGRVVYASTIWAYSDTPAERHEESLPLHPPTHLYTATKLAGELYCHAYGELYGVEHTILRLGIPYGPRARPAAVVPAFVARALAGEPLAIAGDGRQTRRFVYVEDLADGVVRALAPEAANRVYNLVGDEDVTIAEVARAVQRTIGEVPVVDTPGRGGDFAGASVSGERAGRELGWRASTPFVTGVERYVDWHRAQDQAGPERASLGARLGALGRHAIPVALLSCVVAMLAVFLEVLHEAGSGGDDLRTITMTSVLGLTLYLALVPERQPGLGGVALGSGGGSL